MPYLAVVSTKGKAILDTRAPNYLESLAQYPQHICRTFNDRESAEAFLYPEVEVIGPPIFTPLLEGTLAYLTTLPSKEEGYSYYQASITPSDGNTQIFHGTENLRDPIKLGLLALERIASKATLPLCVYTNIGALIEVLKEEEPPAFYRDLILSLRRIEGVKVKRVSDDHRLIQYLRSL